MILSLLYISLTWTLTAFSFGLDVGGTAKVEGYPGNSSNLNNIMTTGCNASALLNSATLDNTMSQVEFVQSSPIALSCFCSVYERSGFYFMSFSREVGGWVKPR